MNLDAMTSPRSSERLTTRLWRRYGAAGLRPARGASAPIPRMAEVLIEGAEYLRCEIELTARREMIVKLDDFLRRRSKIALVIRHEEAVARARPARGVRASSSATRPTPAWPSTPATTTPRLVRHRGNRFASPGK